ncbi:MAG: hypothetical protein ACWGN1_00435 [Desulfobulbales bacterium]
MDNIIKELQKLVSFKDTIAAGDIVLIVSMKPQMLAYGLVHDIVRDKTKREEWWHLSLHILSLPPRAVTWTLRTPQMTGQEIFTMDGEERFMKPIDFSRKISTTEPGKHNGDKKKSGLRRVK